MTATQRPFKAALLAFAVAALVGCGTFASRQASEGDAPYELTENYADGVISYTVQRGDRLGDIALEFTGDVASWQQIAAYNGIEDPRSLRAGSILQIPGDLIPGYAEGLAARRGSTDPAQPESADLAVAADAPAELAILESEPLPSVQPAVNTGLALRTTPSVEISPVDVNRDFELSPIQSTPNGDATTASQRQPLPGGQRVKVVGSYTPRGVYAQPASYSELLMRVAPGTVFDVQSQTDDWYGVVTAAGVGYLRQADVRVLDASGDQPTRRQ